MSSSQISVPSAGVCLIVIREHCFVYRSFVSLSTSLIRVGYRAANCHKTDPICCLSVEADCLLNRDLDFRQWPTLDRRVWSEAQVLDIRSLCTQVPSIPLGRSHKRHAIGAFAR